MTISYQFSVCAKDLMASPLTGLQAVVRMCHNNNNDTVTAPVWHEVGRTEVLSHATTDPVWTHLVDHSHDDDDSDKDDEEDTKEQQLNEPFVSNLSDCTFQVDIVQTTTHNGGVARTTTTAPPLLLHSERVVASAQFEGNDLETARYHAVARYTMQQGDEAAKICLHAVPRNNRGTLRVQFAAHDLPDMDFGMFWWKKHNVSDPFCQIYSAVTGLCVYQTEVIWDDLNPTWQPLTMDIDVLCGGNFDAPIRITVLDQDKGTKTQYLGQVVLSVNDMLQTVVHPDEVASNTRTHKSKTNTRPPKYHALIKGGVPSVKGSLYVKAATLHAQTLVSRKVQTQCQIVLAGLDRLYEKLAAQVVETQQAVQQAQVQHQAWAAQAQEWEAKANAAAWKQHDAQCHLQQVKQEWADLKCTARQTPVDGQLVLQLRGNALPDLDFGFLNKSDPMYEIVLENHDNTSTHRQPALVVLCSNIVPDNLHPVWDVQTLPLRSVGGMETPFSIVVWDINKGDVHDRQLLGSVSNVTVRVLMEAATQHTVLPLVGPSAKKATLTVVKADVKNLIDNVAAVEEYKAQHFQPASDACTKTTQTFEDIRLELERVQDKAAQAKKTLLAAKDKAESAQKALDMIQQGRD